MGIRQSLSSVLQGKNNKEDVAVGEMVERADKDRFLALIIEQLNRSLAVVLGQLDAALIEQDVDVLAHQIRTAHRNARRLERLIGQARQLTQAGSESLAKNEQRILLVPFVESLVMSFEELAERKGVHLEFFARRTDLVGHFDPDDLASIVSNLISRSVRDTPADGRVGVALECASTDAFQITVVDTAPGDEQPDCDIGVALSAMLARAYSGELNSSSTAGQKGRTIVTLPLAQNVQEEPDPLIVDSSGRPQITEEILHRSTTEFQPAPLAEAKPSALIIDENVDLAEWIATELNVIADVRICHDRVAGLGLLRSTLPDILVVGQSHGEDDVLDDVRRIRADERTSHITIIVMSPDNASNTRVAALRAGASDLLAMPIASEELVARATALLEQQQASRATFVSSKPTGVDANFYDKVVETIEAEIGNAEFSVPELADTLAMSTSQLTRKMRALIDKSPAQMIRSMRLERAARMIADADANIATICFAVGFNDQSHFARTFKRYFGIPPSEYRQKAAETASE